MGFGLPPMNGADVGHEHDERQSNARRAEKFLVHSLVTELRDQR